MQSSTDNCGHALSDLIAECELEEVRRQEPTPIAANASSYHVIDTDLANLHGKDALVKIIRQEVHDAIVKEFSLFCQVDDVQVGSCPSSTRASSVIDDSPDGFEMNRERKVPDQILQLTSNLVAGVRETQLAEHMQMLESLRETINAQMENLDRTWKEEAELRAEGDQEVEKCLLGQMEARINTIEAHMSQVSSSVGSLARLQVELRSEAKLRQDADGHIQAFFKEFREHVVKEIQDVWTKYQEMNTNVDHIHRLIGKVVELVEIHGQTPPMDQNLQTSSLEVKANSGMHNVVAAMPVTSTTNASYVQPQQAAIAVTNAKFESLDCATNDWQVSKSLETS